MLNKTVKRFRFSLTFMLHSLFPYLLLSGRFLFGSMVLGYFLDISSSWQSVTLDWQFQFFVEMFHRGIYISENCINSFFVDLFKESLIVAKRSVLCVPVESPHCCSDRVFFGLRKTKKLHKICILILFPISLK